MRPKFRFRPYASVAAMVALFLCVLAFSVINTVREADAVDAERSRQAVAAAVQGEIGKMAALAEDNGIWDDAARVAYSGLTDSEFLWSSWGVSTAEAKLFDTVFVVDQNGAPLYAYRKGRPVRIDPRAAYRGPFKALLARSGRNDTAIGGLATTSEGLVVLGVSNILPTSTSLDPLVPANGAYRLVLARPFDGKTASQIGKALMLEDMRLGGADGAAISTALKAADGTIAGHLSWSPAQPGQSALERALPWIALAAFLHLLVAAILSQQGAKSIRQLFRQALSDSLSGLPNRRALRRELETRLAKSERLGLAMIDLDGFKGINDNFGHPVGDRLIKLVAELLTGLAGKQALVARLGGDEFAVLAAGPNALVTLERIAQALLDHVARPFRIDERTVIVGASIGLASAGIREFDAGEMMRRADVALYAAKAAGKMRLHWYDEALDQQRTSAQVIENELKAAIEADAFDIVYQPALGVQSGTIEAVEALLRWRSPTRGEVCPSEFIPVAEETGLIDRIGTLMLRQACRDAVHWQDVRLTANVSPAQLRNPDFVERLSAILEETGFPASRLELEITETYLVDEPVRARKVIAAIQAAGVAVALDDFGSGYASMNFLRRFGLTRFKIDGALIADAARTAEARAIVQASVAVAHTLGIEVVAEGIETEAQADLMRVAGCDHLQGWLISRAVSAREIGDRLALEGPRSGRRLRLV